MLKFIKTPAPRDGVELPIREVPLARCFFPTIRDLKDIVYPLHSPCVSSGIVNQTRVALLLPCPVCSLVQPSQFLIQRMVA
jgi:hypothetical protein